MGTVSLRARLRLARAPAWPARRGGRARGWPPRNCPQVAPTPTNPATRQPHTPRSRRAIAKGRGHPARTRTTRSTRAMPSARKVQKKSLGA